jgi:hypothetical protein
MRSKYVLQTLPVLTKDFVSCTSRIDYVIDGVPLVFNCKVLYSAPVSVLYKQGLTAANARQQRYINFLHIV